MPFPRFVTARLVSGRSIPISIKGVMQRIRAGDDPISIPYEVYRNHAWKMQLTGDSLGQVNTAIHEGMMVQSAPTQLPQAKVEEPLPEWDIAMAPEHYWSAYSKKKNPSKTIQRRLELAKRIMAHGETE